MTKSDLNIKKLISVDVKTVGSAFTAGSTYTSFFLLPAFGLELTDKLHDVHENSYLDHQGFEHKFERPLFMLFKIGVNEFKSFEKLSKQLLDNDSYVYSYCVGCTNNYYLYMFVFECPKEYTGDYDKFLKGKYSEFSISYKSKFKRSIMTSKGLVESVTYGVLFKTDSQKKKLENILSGKDSRVVVDPNGEFWPAPKEEYEIFQYTKQKSS